MVTESKNGSTVPFMKENGSMMYKKGKEKRPGLMEPSTSANIEMV